MKKNPFWFWSTLMLVALIPILFFYPKEKEENEESEDVKIDFSDTDSLQAVHVQYLRLAEALELRADGKHQPAIKHLRELQKSEIEEIRKIAAYELARPKQISTKIAEPETISHQEFIVEPPTTAELPDINLKELDFTATNVEKLRNTQPFLNLTSSKGKKFEYLGGIVNQKADGYGIGIYESGSVYKGNWKNNLRHGKGVFTWQDGEKYEGNYVLDLREGQGTYLWKNGEKYEGSWKEDRRHGEGTVFKKNGRIKSSGIWENDKLIRKN